MLYIKESEIIIHSNKNKELKIIKQGILNDIEIDLKLNLKQLNRKGLYIEYNAVSLDVAQRSFNKCTAK